MRTGSGSGRAVNRRPAAATGKRSGTQRGASDVSAGVGSIENQTYPNIEVIVINVTGRAHAPVVCQRFPTKLLDLGRPLPRADALNPLLETAQGEWLTHLDDHDWMLSNHIERLYDALAHNPGALVAYAGVACVDVDGAPFDAPSVRHLL